jgi:hypothetical protein
MSYAMLDQSIRFGDPDTLARCPYWLLASTKTSPLGCSETPMNLQNSS